MRFEADGAAPVQALLSLSHNAGEADDARKLDGHDIAGVDYGASEFDRVTQAHRQPGSAFKPFVYLAALEAGISPWDWRDDVPVDIDGYQPANYKNASYGRLRLTDALAHSVNTITVNLAQEVGVTNVAGAARQVGITSPLQDNASLALGTNEVTPLELTAAYCAFANGGFPVKSYFVSRIKSADGRILYQKNSGQAPAPVISDQERRDMTAMLYNVVVSGTGTGARLAGREAAGKTGTTQDYRDAWFVGFTSDYVAGVWIGNDDNSPMHNVTGGSLPALIWKQILTAIEQGHKPTPLDRSPVPADVADEPPPELLTASLSDEDAARPIGADRFDGAILGSGTAPRNSVAPRAPAPAHAVPTARVSDGDYVPAPQVAEQLARRSAAPGQAMDYPAPPPAPRQEGPVYIFMPDGSIIQGNSGAEAAPSPIVVDRLPDPYFR